MLLISNHKKKRKSILRAKIHLHKLLRKSIKEAKQPAYKLLGLDDEGATPRCTCECSSQLEKMRIELQQFKAEMQVTLEAILDKIQPQNVDANENNGKDLPEIFDKFPICDENSLEEIEKLLRTKDSYKASLEKRLRRLGGENPSKGLRSICRFLFADELLEKYSWGGTFVKKNFSSYREMNEIIMKVVHKNFGKFTEHDYRKLMQDYLKFASVRIQRKKNRKAFKDEQEQEEQSTS